MKQITVYKANDESLQETIKQADKNYNEKFQ